LEKQFTTLIPNKKLLISQQRRRSPAHLLPASAGVVPRTIATAPRPCDRPRAGSWLYSDGALDDESGAARGCRRHSARPNPTPRERWVSEHHANSKQPHAPRRTRTPSTLSQHEHGGALVASGL